VVALLAVDPATYDAASAVFGRGIGEPLAGELTRLCDALAGTYAMAGSDPAGAAWGRAYDDAVTTTLAASQDVTNGCFRLAALLQQTGFNYGRAETASTPGRVSTTLPDRTHYEHCAAVLECVPSSAGGSGSAPSGWSMVAHAVGYVWPNGHQDRLRGAGRAWSWSASAVRDAAYAVTAAIEAVGSQRAPEVGDALVACEAMRRHLDELASAHQALAQGCFSYAGHLDEAHSELERELADLVAWTAGIEGSGFVFAVVSAGISEAAAQAAEAARIAAAAARVMAIIRRLVELAGAVTEAISNVVARVLRISGELRTLLATRVLAVVTEEAGELPVIAKTADELAEERLAASAPRVSALPKSSPNFLPPTNRPQLPPRDIPDGYSVRVMPPTSDYVDGYWVETNELGQRIDPSTGKPPGNVTRAQARARTHVPLPP
jgi:hypothetical protein